MQVQSICRRLWSKNLMSSTKRFSSSDSSSSSSRRKSSKLGEFDDKKRSSRWSSSTKMKREWKYTTLGNKIQSQEGKKTEDTIFTLMSYNILADQLAQNHANLYQNSMDSEVMKWETRHARLIDEIQTLDCDILCLQEVQASHFEKYYKNTLQEYQGLYKKRTGQDKVDGCAIFFKSGKFELVDHLEVEYRKTNDGKSCLDRDNIGLLAKFKPKSGHLSQCFVVATTHLLYNPRRSDVRLAQISLLMSEICRFSEAFPVILTGDFNCDERSALFQLLTQGVCHYSPGLNLPPDCDFVPDFYDFHRKNLQQPIKFKSVYYPYETPKAVTTRQDKYVMVDYIFYSLIYSRYLSKFIEGHLKMLGRIQLYSAEDCVKLGHLPNDICPSDHLSLVAKFLLTKRK